MPKLILASSSVYRKQLLQRLGLPFIAVSPKVDEEGFPKEGLTPVEVALALARAKAEAVYTNNRDATVIGSDQLLSLDGVIYGKPGNQSRAVEQLTRFSGRTHELITAVVVLSGGKEVTHVDVTQMHFRDLSQPEILRYIQKDNPVDCAGSYKIEKLGPTLLKSLQTQDISAIEGLPLVALSRMLRDLGFELP